MSFPREVIALRTDEGGVPFRSKLRQAQRRPECRRIWVLTPKEFVRRGLVRLWERDPENGRWLQMGLVDARELVSVFELPLTPTSSCA